MRVRSSSRAMTLPVLLGAFVVFGCESATDPVSAGLEPTLSTVEAGYTLQDIGTLGGAFSVAFDVNDDGTVVGRSQTAEGSIHAFAFSDGVMQDLGSPGSGASEAWLVGAGGHVAGIFREGAVTRTAVWANGGVTDIGDFGGSFTAPTGVDPAGTVVGWSRLPDGSRHAFRWSAGSLQDLGTLGGLESAALAVNATGDAVGWARDASGNEHAVMWPAAGGIVDLGTLGGLYSEALAINDAGSVAGTAQTASGDMHAFVWSPVSRMVDVTPSLSGAAEALALNESGQAAVRVMSTSDHAFLWDGAQLVDLATLGGAFSDAEDVDAAGVVAGVSETSDGMFVAAAWAGPDPAALPLGGADAGAAKASNSGGTIVGNIRFGSVLHAAVWTADGDGGDGGDGGEGGSTDPIQALIDAVQAMADAGTLSAGRANSLHVSLYNAMRRRDEGRTTEALLQLRAFSHKVQAMVYSGQLVDTEASGLFGMYVEAVTSLG
jgi:probable HAF family extracellular repeat protein